MNANENIAPIMDGKKPRIMLSSFTPEEKLKICSIIQKLRGVLIEGLEFSSRATHIICKRPSRGEKFLCGCAAGILVLTEDYINASLKSGKWVDEGKYLWEKQVLDISYTDAERCLQKSIKLWKLFRPFATWKVIIYLQDRKKLRAYIRLLSAGGATIICRKPPFGEFIHKMAIILSDKTSFPMFAALTQAGRKVHSVEYIVDHLIKIPQPAKSKYLITKGLTNSKITPTRTLSTANAKPSSLNIPHINTRTEQILKEDSFSDSQLASDKGKRKNIAPIIIIDSSSDSGNDASTISTPKLPCYTLTAPTTLSVLSSGEDVKKTTNRKRLKRITDYWTPKRKCDNEVTKSELCLENICTPPSTNSPKKGGMFTDSVGQIKSEPQNESNASTSTPLISSTPVIKESIQDLQNQRESILNKNKRKLVDVIEKQPAEETSLPIPVEKEKEDAIQLSEISSLGKQKVDLESGFQSYIIEPITSEGSFKSSRLSTAGFNTVLACIEENQTCSALKMVYSLILEGSQTSSELLSYLIHIIKDTGSTFSIHHKNRAIGMLYQCLRQHPVGTCQSFYLDALQPYSVFNGDQMRCNYWEFVSSILNQASCPSKDKLSNLTLQLIDFITTVLVNDYSNLTALQMKNTEAKQFMIYKLLFGKKDCSHRHQSIIELTSLFVNMITNLVDQEQGQSNNHIGKLCNDLAAILSITANCMSLESVAKVKDFGEDLAIQLDRTIANQKDCKFKILSSVFNLLRSGILSASIADYFISQYDAKLENDDKSFRTKPLSFEKLLSYYLYVLPQKKGIRLPKKSIIPPPKTTTQRSRRVPVPSEKQKQLMRSKVKRNAKGETPLHTACIKGNADTVRILLNQGADPNCTDFAGWTPLHEASNKGNLECVNELLSSKDINVLKIGQNGMTALHDAVRNNHIDVVEALCQNGGKELVSTSDSNGNLPVTCTQNEKIKEILQNTAGLQPVSLLSTSILTSPLPNNCSDIHETKLSENIPQPYSQLKITDLDLSLYLLLLRTLLEYYKYEFVTRSHDKMNNIIEHFKQHFKMLSNCVQQTSLQTKLLAMIIGGYLKQCIRQ